MAYLNHNLPPFSAYIRNEYLYDHEKGHGDFTFADVHTVNSLERRALLFECLLAIEVKSEESIPPDKKTPTGTSDIILSFTDFSNEFLISNL